MRRVPLTSLKIAVKEHQCFQVLKAHIDKLEVFTMFVPVQLTCQNPTMSPPILRAVFQTVLQTSRDRPKSAPYPRLKNSKRTSKCQFRVLENRKAKKNRPSGAPGHASARPGALKRKNFFKKNLTTPKKLKGGTLWDFSTSILSQNSNKN